MLCDYLLIILTDIHYHPKLIIVTLYRDVFTAYCSLHNIFITLFSFYMSGFVTSVAPVHTSLFDISLCLEATNANLLSFVHRIIVLREKGKVLRIYVCVQATILSNCVLHTHYARLTLSQLF